MYVCRDRDAARHVVGWKALTVDTRCSLARSRRVRRQIHTKVSGDGVVDKATLGKMEEALTQNSAAKGVVVEFGYDVTSSCWRPKCVRGGAMHGAVTPPPPPRGSLGRSLWLHRGS